MPPPYARGHVRAPNKDHLIELSHQRHRARLHALAAMVTPPPTWDSRTLGWIGPVKDQAQCGSCWDFSGTGVVEVAYNVAKVGGGASDFILSEEYTLDCGSNGGCQGDDNTTVLAWAKATGLPLTSAYGPYTSGSGRTGSCAFKSGMQLYKIDDWGFVDKNGGQGVTPTADIKIAIMTYGCVGCAVAAGSSWDSWSSDPNYVHTGGSTAIDHDVRLIGWDDSKTAWLMLNNWGIRWALNGFGWIAYGADSIGTESVFAFLTHTPTPTPTPPPPPTPTPTPGGGDAPWD